jgi:hypothetical protein
MRSSPKLVAADDPQAKAQVAGADGDMPPVWRAAGFKTLDEERFLPCVLGGREVQRRLI